MGFFSYDSTPSRSDARAGKENHVWLVWDHSRRPGLPLFAGKNPEPARRSCIMCHTPLPPDARADKRTCSATCRQILHRSGLAQRRIA